MPRTNLCKPGYRIAIEKLTKWISRQGKQREIAEGIGISPQLMSYKIKHNSFTAEDLIRIFHFLDAEPDDIVKVMKY